MLESKEITFFKIEGFLLCWVVCHYQLLKYIWLRRMLVKAKHKLLCESDTTPDKISELSQHQASTMHLLVVNTIRLSGWFIFFFFHSV